MAKEKWERRVKRVNWDNLIIKNSYMCHCDDDLVRKFQTIKGIKKFMFVPNQYQGDTDDLVKAPSRSDSATDLGDEAFDLNKYVDTTELINRPITGWKDLYSDI